MKLILITVIGNLDVLWKENSILEHLGGKLLIIFGVTRGLLKRERNQAIWCVDCEKLLFDERISGGGQGDILSKNYKIQLV